MASVKLRTYFDSEAANPLFSAEVKVECVSTVMHCEHNVKKAIEEKRIALGPMQTTFEPLIQKLKRKLNFDLEEQIKQEKLKEAKRMEDELKQRLELVQENITTLGSVPEEHKATKLKLLSKDVRESVQQTEREKTNEAKRWTVAFREEQRLREEKRLKFAEEVAMKCEEEKKAMEQTQEEQERERERKKQERIEYMKSLSAKRQQQLAEVKEVLAKSKIPKRSVSESPSDEHKHSPEHPHVSIQQLVKEHSSKYKETKQTYEAKRFQQLISQKMAESVQPSKHQHYFFDVVSERHALLAEEKKKTQFKEELQTRQKRYASLIKEMYAPVPNREKQLELEKIRNRIHTIPRVAKPIDRTTRPYSLMLSHTESLETDHTSQNKKPKSVQLAEEETKKRPNYLPAVRQMRLQRQSESRTHSDFSMLSTELGDLSAQKDTSKLLHKANLLEKKAIHEARLLRASDPLNLATLEKVDDVDSALVSSVKAKLSLLSA